MQYGGSLPSLLTLTIVAVLPLSAEAAPPIPVRSLSSASVSRPAARAASTDPRAMVLTSALRQRLEAVLRVRPGTRRSRSTPAVPLGVRMRIRPQTGTPAFIAGQHLQPAVRSLVPGRDTARDTARAFLRNRRSWFRLADPDTELVLVEQRRGPLGRTHLRYRQLASGIPVWPSDLRVHLDPASNVDRVEAWTIPTEHEVGTPRVRAQRARRIAALAVGADPGAAGEPELIVHAPGDRPPALSWKVLLPVGLEHEWVVVVDAATGTVRTRFDQVPREAVEGSGIDLLGRRRTLQVWNENGTFWLVDTSKPMFDPGSRPPRLEDMRGAIVVLDAQNSTPDEEGNLNLSYVTSPRADSWDPADAVSAAAALSQVYDYYRDRHERNSIDGKGGSLVAVVRFGRDFANAFWSSSSELMVFGDADRYAASLDVVAHEMTHGVTDKTADLVYENQSGALNEAMSDIFGEMVERFARGDNDWVLGTDLTRPIRDMSRPEDFGDPSRMSDFVITEEDNGGVHTNSGIINHAFYLLAEGLPNAIGTDQAAAIFYRALTTHLVARSQFIDARLACISSAEELFGEGSQEVQRTAEAFDAVEIFGDQGTPPPAPLPPVEGADATLFLFWDPLQAGFFLARQDPALSDPPGGVQLSAFPVAPSRPSVSGDGSFAVFVNPFHDVCFIRTDGVPIEGSYPESCLGFDFIHSVAMEPAGDRFAFVLLDSEGEPENALRVIDIESEATRTFTLEAPVIDGTTLNTIAYADALDFSPDGGLLAYDALNVIQLPGGETIGTWSVFALDLERERFLDLVPPVIGLDIGFPAFAQTSSRYLTLDVFHPDTGSSTVLAIDLLEGTAAEIGTVQGFGVPGYTGEDRSIVYSLEADTPTGFALVEQPLAPDHVSPSGDPQLWLAEGDLSAVYRRGEFTGPGTPTPTWTLPPPRTPTPSPSPTRRDNPTPTPTPTGRDLPTPTPTTPPSGGPCPGDCDRDGAVGIAELVLAVNIALDRAEVTACAAVDTDGSGSVTIAELIAAVRSALAGCPG